MSRNPIAAGRQCPVIDFESVTEDEFFDQFVGSNEPVKIVGGMKKWKALERWNEPGYFESVFGDKEIPIAEVGGGEISSLPMPLSKFWPRVRQPPQGRYCMIVERPIVVFGDRPAMLHEVRGDIELPPYLQRLEHTRATMFAGHGTRSPCHYHPGGEVLLCQVVGRKRVLLYPPTREASRALYPRPMYTGDFLTSPIRFPMDGSNPDLERYPRYAQAPAIECVLDPGEMLYIPIYWWHHAFCSEMSVSVGHFYTAQKRKRYMKLKGLRCNLFTFRVLRYWWRLATGTVEQHLADGGRRVEKRKIPSR